MTGSSSKPSSLWQWVTDASQAWDHFWYYPRAPHTLAVIRIATGLMIAYMHGIWLSQVSYFFGPTAWVDGATNRALHAGDYCWSYLAYTSNVTLISGHEIVALVAGLAMAVGYKSRIVTPIAWFLTLMVCHRQTGALFGLDQIVMMLCMYLIFSRCGDAYSVDQMLAQRQNRSPIAPSPSVSNNIATRLMQLHLCIIYLFGGISKMRGDFWWEGSAMWWSIANYEYQSLDVVWLGRSPMLIALATHVTLFWETFYCALIWPRWTRPIVLLLAVLVHGGIAIFLGMPTFGTMMIVANMAFIEPETTERWLMGLIGRLRSRPGANV